jgi:hypothetical protein
MRRIMTVTLILAYFTVSCASYTAKSLATPAIESSAASREEQGLRVGVNPYVEAEKTKQIFDADLKQALVLALEVLVSNNGPRRLTVRKSDFILRLPAGREVAPARAEEVAARLESFGGVVGWTIAFGLVGLLASSMAKNNADTARRADFGGKEFHDATVFSGEAAHGFLFFLIPDDVRDLKNASLVVKGTDDVNAARISVEIPLGDLGVWQVRETQTTERPNF